MSLTSQKTTESVQNPGIVNSLKLTNHEIRLLRRHGVDRDTISRIAVACAIFDYDTTKPLSEQLDSVRNSPLAYSVAETGKYPSWFQKLWVYECWLGDENRYVIIASREFAKTHYIVEQLIPWYIGKFPEKTNFICSVTSDQAKKRFESIQLTIVNSETFKVAFPDVVPDYERGWNTEVLSVKRASMSYGTWMRTLSQKKVPTLSYAGVGANRVTGDRYDGLVVADDLNDEKNTATLTQRQKIQKWFRVTLIGAVMQGAKIIMLGARYHRDDMVGIYSKIWKSSVVPLIDALTGESNWPEVWNMKRIKERFADINEQEIVNSQYLCDPSGYQRNMFKREWFKPFPERLPLFDDIYIGCDLAISQNKKSAYTALVVVGVDDMLAQYILRVSRGKWSFNGIINKIDDIYNWTLTHHGYVKRVFIEQVQFQAAVVQETLRKTKVPATGVYPEGDKILRATPMSALAESGYVFADHSASWFSPFADEAEDFPSGARKDMIDAWSIINEAIKTRSKTTRIETEGPIITMITGW